MGGTGLFGYRLGNDKGPVQIEGLKEVQYELRRLGVDAKNDMKPAHKKAAEIVAAEAARKAPVRTGQLQSTIRAFGRQKAGVVRVGNKQIPYAGPIIFGWPARRIKPNPFIYDAADARRSEIATVYSERMGEIIRKHGLQLGAPASGLSSVARSIK